MVYDFNTLSPEEALKTPEVMAQLALVRAAARRHGAEPNMVIAPRVLNEMSRELGLSLKTIEATMRLLAKVDARNKKLFQNSPSRRETKRKPRVVVPYDERRFPPSTQRVLDWFASRGWAIDQVIPSPVRDECADALGVTSSCIGQHLARLRKEFGYSVRKNQRKSGSPPLTNS